MSLIQLDYAEGRVESAKDRLKRILSANPTNTRANLWLGNLEAKAGDAHSALRSFQQVLKVDPGHPQALNNTAFLLVAYGNQPDEALKYAEKAHELAPANPDYSDTLGWILYRKGIYSSAASTWKRRLPRW